MQRIVKRFLLHNQRETNETNERNFDELKQDLQMIRYEMQNDLKKSKEESFHSITLLHAGLTILGEEIFRNTTNLDNLGRFNDYKFYGNEMREMYKDEFVDNTDENGVETTSANTLHSNIQKFPQQLLNLNIAQKKRSNLKKHFTFYEIVNNALSRTDSTDSKSVTDMPLAGSLSWDNLPRKVINEIRSNQSESNLAKKEVSFSDLDTIHQIESNEETNIIKQDDSSIDN